MNTNFGAVNRGLALLDLPALNWLGDPWAAKGAILLVNLWLGFPFIMTATLGALSAIPDDLYEAAKIDGANAWRRFTGVTAPLLRTALVPIALTGFAFNFNNFNIIYLLTDGGPFVEGYTSTARSTDILISWAYNEAFRAQGGYAYGLGSAISLLIFFIHRSGELGQLPSDGCAQRGVEYMNIKHFIPMLGLFFVRCFCARAARSILSHP